MTRYAASPVQTLSSEELATTSSTLVRATTKARANTLIGMSWATGAMTCCTEATGTTNWGQRWGRMRERMSIMAGMETMFLVAWETRERMSIMAGMATMGFSRLGIGGPTSSIAAK